MRVRGFWATDGRSQFMTVSILPIFKSNGSAKAMTTAQPNRYSSQGDIIKFCANPPFASLISGEYANKIVKLPDETLVKYGYCVVFGEAENQRLARERVDLDIVYIPEVYRYFDDEEGNQGYILMELVQGKVLHSLDDPAETEQMSRILSHFATIDGRNPGPLGGGTSPALIFGEAGAPSFSTAADLDQWVNARVPKDRHVSFSKFPLVLCHLDIAPENMIWRPQQSPCLIDWASAGFYPQPFEIASQRIGPQTQFKEQILSCFQLAIKEQGPIIDAILLAWFECHRRGL